MRSELSALILGLAAGVAVAACLPGAECDTPRDCPLGQVCGPDRICANILGPTLTRAQPNNAAGCEDVPEPPDVGRGCDSPIVIEVNADHPCLRMRFDLGSYTSPTPIPLCNVQAHAMVSVRARRDGGARTKVGVVPPSGVDVALRVGCSGLDCKNDSTGGVEEATVRTDEDFVVTALFADTSGAATVQVELLPE